MQDGWPLGKPPQDDSGNLAWPLGETERHREQEGEQERERGTLLSTVEAEDEGRKSSWI
jgi:hypothetical protein